MQTRILRLNLAGQPIDWLHWEEAVCLYARDIVIVDSRRCGTHRAGRNIQNNRAKVKDRLAEHYCLWRRANGKASHQ